MTKNILSSQSNANNSKSSQKKNCSEHLIKPLPIYIKGVLDFSGLFTELIELIGVDNFICKSTVDRLKIQTKHSEPYRETISLLK